eukprot:8731336-Ditylum_brightwellii.AAC.1
MAEQVANVEATTAAATGITKVLDANTLGMWKNFQYNIELQEGVKLYHSRLYRVPKAYKAMLCME